MPNVDAQEASRARRGTMAASMGGPMWVSGRIVTRCVPKRLPVHQSSGIEPQHQVLSISGLGGVEDAFVVNRAWRCASVAHSHAIQSLTELIKTFGGHEACKLVAVEVDENRQLLTVAFRVRAKIIGPHLRTLAPYCLSSNPDIDPNPDFGLNSVLLESARGYKEFTEQLKVYSMRSTADFSGGVSLLSIPRETFDSKIVPYLTAKDIRMLNKTCTHFKTAGVSFVPGLRPTLFKHQRASLFLMELQEATPSYHDEMFSYQLNLDESQNTSESDTAGELLYLDVFSGKPCARDKPSCMLHPNRTKRGGLLCDAPGLGKTVTMLSLVLRTKGMLPYQMDSLEDTVERARTKRPSLPREAKDHRSPFKTSTFGSQPQKTTLVIVPPTLLSHWEQQICHHLEPNALKWARIRNLSDADRTLDLALISTKDVPSEPDVLSQHGFLRVIVDEGHSLGSNSQTGFMSTVRNLRAERFWIVTGTPAKMTSVQDGLNSLRNILKFIGAWPETQQEWSYLITKPFKRHVYAAKHLLLRILRKVMVRHRKEDLVSELPVLECTRTLLRFNEEARQMYNIFVSFVRSNILLTTIGSTGGSELSLLHPRNRKQCAELVTNMRLVCTAEVNETTRLVLRPDDREQTMQLLWQEPTDVRERISGYLGHVVNGGLSRCESCLEMFHMLLITRCGHFFCVECINLDKCIQCGQPIDQDDLAAIQPGFSLTRSVVSAAYLGAKSKRILDRIYLEREMFARNPVHQRPKFIIFSQFQGVLNIVGDKLIRALGKDAVAEFWTRFAPLELKKFTSNQVAEWHCDECGRRNDDPLTNTCKLPLVYVRVESSPNVVHVVKNPAAQMVDYDPLHPPNLNQLVNVRLGEGMNFVPAYVCRVAPCKGRRTMTIHRDVQCDVLLLPKEGYHGLDLSCATHIFLLDVLWDTGVEEQLVSRAWRLGNRAKKVVVEQLLMSESLEEILVSKALSQSNSLFSTTTAPDDDIFDRIATDQETETTSADGVAAGEPEPAHSDAQASPYSAMVGTPVSVSRANGTLYKDKTPAHPQTDARIKSVLESIRLVRPENPTNGAHT